TRLPEQISTARPPARTPALIIAACAAMIALAVVGIFLWQRQKPATSVPQQASVPATSTLAVTAPAVIPEKSIAVLPFENLSDEKQNAFFTDGVQDEILTALAKIADLKVISRSSVMQYK